MREDIEMVSKAQVQLALRAKKARAKKAAKLLRKS